MKWNLLQGGFQAYGVNVLFKQLGKCEKQRNIIWSAIGRHRDCLNEVGWHYGLSSCV